MTHRGTEAMSSAARLEGTSCSATVTTAFAPMSSVPTSSPERSSARVGAGAAPRRASTARSTAPARRNRAPAPSSGGTVSTITRMARYVDPQTM